MSSKTYKYGEDISFDEIIITDITELDGFDCGNIELNKYMWECAEENSSTIHTLVDKDLQKIIGVCFLKCSAYVKKQVMICSVDFSDNVEMYNALKNTANIESVFYNEEIVKYGIFDDNNTILWLVWYREGFVK